MWLDCDNPIENAPNNATEDSQTDIDAEVIENEKGWVIAAT